MGRRYNSELAALNLLAPIGINHLARVQARDLLSLHALAERLAQNRKRLDRVRASRKQVEPAGPGRASAH